MTSDGVELARSALARGDLLMAYDAAVSAHDGDGRDVRGRYLAALALVRMGSVAEATREILAIDLARLQECGGASGLCEDIEALTARLAKERAFAHRHASFEALALEAGRSYEEVGDRYGGFYALVNAATLYRLGGDVPRARELARRSIHLAEEADPSYWSLATLAEASMVLGEMDDARRYLEAAVASGQPSDLAARATTHKQLTRLIVTLGAGAEVLDVLRLPRVLHYCGNMSPQAGMDQLEWEDGIVERVRAFLDETEIAIAFGSAAAGADLLIAEQLIARRVELHVVLPFSAEEFLSVSVTPWGDQWRRRFDHCLESSASVTVACDSAYLEDESMFGFASRVAMGHALNRARFLGIDPVQLAVTDGRFWSDTAGTARDISAWRRSGAAGHVVDVGGDRGSDSPWSQPSKPQSGEYRAVVFADFRGISRLRDEHYEAFITGVLGPVAELTRELGDDVLYRNSWGDSIQLVLCDVREAARWALEVQQLIAQLDMGALGLPDDLELRVAVHAGRVIAQVDPIRDVLSFWGREMTRAARIEPRTPEGEVYVTDTFAALLALEPDPRAECEYVGRVTTAKGFETIPMYRLRSL